MARKQESNSQKTGNGDRSRGIRSDASVKDVFVSVRRDLTEGRNQGYSESAEHYGFGGRLRYLWKRSRLTVGELSEAIDVSTSTFNAWMAGGSSPGLDNLVRIQEVTGISVQWLATGQEPMVLGAEGNRLPAVAGQVDGFVYVPRYDVRAGAGAGQIVESENLKGFVAFREDWVRTRLRRNPINLKVIEAFGDSMSPTISDGDIMLVDTSEDRVRGAAIYIVLAGNEVIVKRVELKIDGTLEVKSDNPAYEPITLRGHQIAELRVIGKVVWSGGLV